MEPIDKLTKKNKNEVNNRNVSSRGGESNTQDNFYRRSSKAPTKGDSYGTILQILKSDIFQIQETINESSSILKLFKICSKSPAFSKKVNEIEENRDVKSLLDRINDESFNIDKITKTYGCSSINEVVQKLALEVNYYELFIKKLNELFFILNLKTSGEDNLFQDTFSKYFLIKIVLDKISTENNNNTYITNNIEMNNTYIDEELLKLKDIKSLSALFETFKDSNNENINKIISIFKEFLDKMNINYTDLINKYSSKKSDPFDSIQVDKFLTQKLLLEKILTDKDKIISELNKELSDLKLNIKDYQEEIDKIKNEKNIEPKEDTKGLLKIIEENNKIINSFKNDYARSDKLLEEIKDIATKYEKLSDKYDLIIVENKELKKNIEFISNKMKKDPDFESYEELLKEQFDNMKNSFVQKLDQLNEQLVSEKSNYRKKVYYLEEELEKTKNIKDLFLRQLTELQKFNK